MDETLITASLTSQYQAALGMFRGAVTGMPSARWNDTSDVNATWRIAYHALFFTHLYLSGSEEAYAPWGPALVEATGADEPLALPADTVPYSREQILAYADAIEAMLPAMVPLARYDGPSGFSWISISRFEHHLYNIRHLMHHTGQLAERTRAAGGGGLEWKGRGPAAIIVKDTVG